MCDEVSGRYKPNALSSIIALPSGGNSQQQQIITFSPGMTYIPSLMSFGVYSGSEKCDYFGRRKIRIKTNNP